MIFFPEEVLLKEPVDKWPLCEALIAFFSTGFPLKKAQEYAALRQPYVFNDLNAQERGPARGPRSRAVSAFVWLLYVRTGVAGHRFLINYINYYLIIIINQYN